MQLAMVSTNMPTFKNPGILLPGEKYTLGRASDCAFVLKDLSISRIHAELSVNHACVVVKDCKSLNGTFFNGVRVTEAELQPGQYIVFGRVHFRVANPAIGENLDEEFSDLSTHTNKRLLLPAVQNLLSGAEFRVLELLLQGLREREIGEILNNSRHTIHNHVKKIYSQLGVKSRAALLTKFQ